MRSFCYFMLLLALISMTMKFTFANDTATLDKPTEKVYSLEEDEDLVGYDDDAVNVEEFIDEMQHEQQSTDEIYQESSDSKPASTPNDSLPKAKPQKKTRLDSIREERRRTKQSLASRGKKSSPASSSDNTSGHGSGGPKKSSRSMAGMGDENRYRDLESKLSDKLRSTVAQAELQQQEREYEKLQRRQRFMISRRQAAPVERLIRLYDDLHCDLYRVLGVSYRANEVTMKKQYRSLALILHPDKNPHPDAKSAFDALQDAYDTLSSPTKRKDYNKELLKGRRARAWTIKNITRYFRDFLSNFKADIVLAVVQWKKGESLDLFAGLSGDDGFLSSIQSNTWYMLEHIVLLPSAYDRFVLCNEWWFDRRNIWRILGFISLVTLLVPR